MMHLEWILIAVLIFVLILSLLRNKKSSEEEVRLRALELLAEWKQKEAKKIRQEAIAGSRSVTLGKSIEHIIPYFKDFPYNPRDVRFLGSPIDLVVFDGLSAGKLKEVVFVEVKTGKHARLPLREKMVKECIEEGRLAWELLHYNDQ